MFLMSLGRLLKTLAEVCLFELSMVIIIIIIIIIMKIIITTKKEQFKWKKYI